MEPLPPPVQVQPSEITTKEELEQSDASETDGVAQSSSHFFMASSSSSSHPPRYQVFLSFRGGDTRHNFTSHLLGALVGGGIKVFYDEKELEKGEELSPTLLNAIAASKVSIIILSKDYASSNSCLMELSQIMECKHTRRQIVLPIFYQVNPADVRHHRESFKQSFDQHLKEKREGVESWKTAFTEVGGLKGWDIQTSSDRSEAEYVKDIVKVVTEKLSGRATYISEEFVGTYDQIEEILWLLEKEDIRVIGIWGMGGIGKTAIAEAVYNEVRSHSKFDAYHFLQDVRQRSLETNGMQSLQHELLSKLLKEDVRVDTPFIGSTLIHDRLCNIRAFVVLDDVNNLDQIKRLGVKHFGPGSEIIITSRDRQVLRNIGVDELHHVEELNEDDSLQLFCLFAFKQYNPDVGFREVAIKFVKYGGGNPLALKVLGATLYEKKMDVWESALDKLKVYPEQDIFGPLKISYDGLGDLEKNLFLDIACFHNGEPVEEILHCCYDGAKSGIDKLVDKCLIDDESSYYTTIKMHDLLQEMGREIVLKESEDPGRRSRLWSPEDVCYVLKNKKGTRSIKGISVDMHAIKAAVHICPSVFKKMVGLKFIQFYGERCKKLLVLNNELKYLPDELRYFRWDDCPLNSLPSKYSPNKLVELSLRNSKIRQLWSGDADVVNLKVLDVSGCKKLRKIPNLSGATKLVKLVCDWCTRLVELPCMKHLTSLKELNLDMTAITKLPEVPTNGALEILKLGCTLINEVPSLHVTSLKELNLYGCAITKFPEIPTNGALKKLHLRMTQIEEVPSLMWSLKELRYLSLCGTKIRNIPSSILKSDVLSEIYLADCANLTELNFDRTPIEEAQTSSNSRAWLLYLDVSNCKSLKSLLGLPIVESLSAENCTSLERISFIDRDPGYDYSYYASKFDFRNCSSLSEDARSKIIAAYPMIIGPSQAKRRAKRLAEDEKFRMSSNFSDNGVICYLPRSEIPDKFEKQSRNLPRSEIPGQFEKKSRNFSITVKLDSTTRFLCFALCLVLDSDDFPQYHFNNCDIDCKYQLKGGIDGDKTFRLTFQRDFRRSYGEHVCFLFGKNIVHRDMRYTNASFAFRVVVKDKKVKKVKKVKVEKCGVHVFYVDAESFAISRAVSSTDFSSDGQDNDESGIDFSDEEDTDFRSDEDTRCGEGSMVEEDANVENNHKNPASANDDGYRLDKGLTAFSIAFSSHEDIRSRGPSGLSLGLGGPIVEDDEDVENGHDDPARTTLAPKRIFSSNDDGDHPNKRLKRSCSS